MIPLRILMDVEDTPIVNEGEVALQPQALAILRSIGVLTEGTKEGNPVVILRVQMPEGNFVLAETTLRLLQVAMRAFTVRYGDLSA